MAYRIFRTAIGLILLILIGCAQNPLALERVVADSDSNVLILEPSNEPSADSNPSAAPFTAIESEQNPAVLALIHQAERHWQDGNIQHAEVALERALRINPKDLKLYRLLAELKLESGELQVAAQLVRKGLALAEKKDQQGERERLLLILERISALSNI